MKNKKDFYVVGIGASAGGLDAVQQLFDYIPNNTGIAFVIIQHLSPDFKSLMPELLAKHTKMKIFTAESNQEIKPNCVYLNQRSKNIGIKNNKFILLDKAPKNSLNLPIDILFHMLGEAYKDKAVGVILSGTGSDGSRGIKTIKEAGGTILVQEPESAQFNGMPNSAISTNLQDFILPPEGIAEKILQFTAKRMLLSGLNDTTAENEKTFQSILSEILKQSGLNFKKYKVNTLLRRLEKRLNLHNIETLEDYLTLLKNNEKERNAITQEFLIGVTSFFRDKDAFYIIRKTVVPAICSTKEKHETIRIWMAGCSSGEEVYSVAILFEDYIRNNKLGMDYKIFATDVDKKALQRASVGNYPVNNCVEIEKQFLEEYFLKTGDKIQIIKRIRDKIVFSYHDVTNDPPFIKVDLICCRNLLIYFSNSAQKYVLSAFHYALNNKGYLFLGSSESLGNIGNLFKTIDTKHKIFQTLNSNKVLVQNRLTEENPFKISSGVSQQYGSNANSNNIVKRQNELLYYKYLSKKHAPVSVFIDSEFTVQFIQGDFKKWFSQADGIYSNNLLNMVNSELGTIIRNGVRRLKQSKNTASVKNLVCIIGNEKVTTDLFFERTVGLDSADDSYLIQFGLSPKDNSAEQIVLSNEDISNFSKQRIDDLEYELKEARSELQNTVEELETSNEELQSSNEELQSSNEELQSVNEELYTVNTEFQEKNKELENLNNDIQNLLNSTDIGTLFLDTNLNIRKFTPSIKRLFNLEDSDIGRSINSFASEFEEETRKSIISDSKASYENLKTFEKEVYDKKGNWYLKRIIPFITSDKKIEGIVITFVDISNLKKVKYNLIESDLRLTTALEAGNMAWWEMELPSGKLIFNKNKTQMLGLNYEDFTHFKDFMNIVHPDDYENAMDAMRMHLDGKTDKYECQYRLRNSEGNYQWFQDIGKIAFQTEEKTIVSGIVIEFTTRKQTDLQLLESMKKAETANIYKNQFLANMSHEIRTPLNGLVGFAQLLRNESLDVETKNMYIDVIESSSKILLNLINDIMDISKIEAGELKMNMSNCDLQSMFLELKTTFDTLKNKNGKDNVEIIVSIPEALKGMVIKTDPARLKQVLTNLLDNSLKFTESGKVELGYAVKKNKVVFKVSDTGIGMSKDNLDIIFERFQQLEHSDKAKYTGTGLGLAISKGIINLMGGSINVESEELKGSVFTFDILYLPAGSDSELITGSDMQNIELFRDKKILIAEDDHYNRIYIKELLKDIPLNIFWAENGVEAVEKFKQNKEISLILMDIRMPLLDGYKAAKQILEYKPDALIIAQTAYAISSEKEKCIENGFVDYLSKPIRKERLMEVMVKWIQN